MRKSIFNLSSWLLFASCSMWLGLAQWTTKASEQSSPAGTAAQRDEPPQKLVARGTITRVEYADAPCGDYMSAAAFEIRLKGKLRGYAHPFLYVVVPCLYQPEGAEKPLNRSVQLAVERQDRWQPCFSDEPQYRIDSGGLPYYCAGRREILRAIAHQPISSAPVEFKGTLEWGPRYRAQLTYDRDGVWRTRVRVRVPYHHAALIEWTNLREFPQLDKAKNAGGQPWIVFKVLAREIVRLRDRWDVTFRCRILAVE